MSFVFIAVPTSAQNSLQSVQDSVSKAKCTTMNIPPLKVGTLDELITLSDDLYKADLFMESVNHKIVHQLSELKPNKAELRESIRADHRTLDAYLSKFEWDSRRFNPKLSIRDLSNQLKELVTQAEAEMKGRIQAYNQIKGKLQAEDRKSQGSLLVRSLVDIVKPKHVLADSEFMETLMVVVPKYAYSEWRESYASLSDYVCPGSSELVAEDSEYGLFSVTLFQKIAGDFKAAAKEKKFIVRDFKFQVDEIQTTIEERQQLGSDFKEKHGQLSEWLQLTLDDVFTSWAHIKALRLFVEAVLRYGLPPQFSYFALYHSFEQSSRVRSDLGRKFGYLDKTGMGGDDVELPGMQHGDYYPYVCADIDLAFASKA